MESRLEGDVVVLAGTDEVRVLGSAGEAARELAGGFRPAVVLLGGAVGGASADEFARWMEADPGRARIPVLAMSAGADRLRITLVSERLEVASPEADQLHTILRVLDELCS